MATKEELLLRALDTTNMADHIHEDLSDLITMITPADVPLFARLGRTKATAMRHEWTETALTTTFTNSKYADGGLPANHDNTPSRFGNDVMSIGRVAKATNLLRALNLVGQKDALAKDLDEKMQDLMRAIEYYIINGDSAAVGDPEMDGLLKRVAAVNGATVVDNQVAAANAVLSEANLQKAITGCYNKGGRPNLILARPEVAYQIANFTADKIRYVAGGAAGGVDNGTLRYLSPFGNVLEVVPVRADFLPSGNILVVEESKVKLAFASNGIEIDEIPVAADAESKLVKAYLTLETRGLPHHAKITGVADA